MGGRDCALSGKMAFADESFASELLTTGLLTNDLIWSMIGHHSPAILAYQVWHPRQPDPRPAWVGENPTGKEVNFYAQMPEFVVPQRDCSAALRCGWGSLA
jgi:hypothetical protein